jgi:hypothetical protein
VPRDEQFGIERAMKKPSLAFFTSSEPRRASFLYQGWLNLQSSPWLGMFYKKQLPSPRPIRALITFRQCHSFLTPFIRHS